VRAVITSARCSTLTKALSRSTTFNRLIEKASLQRAAQPPLKQERRVFGTLTIGSSLSLSFELAPEATAPRVGRSCRQGPPFSPGAPVNLQRPKLTRPAFSSRPSNGSARSVRAGGVKGGRSPTRRLFQIPAIFSLTSKILSARPSPANVEVTRALT